MKSILFALVFAFAGSAMAQTKTLKGYVAQRGNTERSFLITANVSKLEVDGYLPLNFFTKEQTIVMGNCMQKRETHAILVDQIPSTQHGVPTGMPGRTVTTHMPRYENVRCAPAPGFLEVWRAIVTKHFSK